MGEEAEAAANQENGDNQTNGVTNPGFSQEEDSNGKQTTRPGMYFHHSTMNDSFSTD